MLNPASDQKIIAIEAMSSDTIQNINSIIQAKEGIDSDQYTLVHNGKVLEDESILSSLNISYETTFHLVFNPKDVLPIFVRTVDGETLKLEVKVLFTIRDVKTIVGSMTNVLNIDCDVIYAGKKLEDCKTLASYDIQEEIILEMFPALIQIFVKEQGGRTIALNVQPCNTIKDVKDKVSQKQTGVLDNDWDLIYAGKQLEDWRTLASYDIKEEAILEMFPALIRIFVIAQDGGTITLDVQLCNTIKEVKDELSDILFISYYVQCILFNGKQLEDDRDLASYGVQMDSTLHMVSRPKSFR
jgi:ubiquitin C